MNSKLKLIDLAEGRFKVKKVLLNPHDFIEVIKDPVMLYLTITDDYLKEDGHPYTESYFKKQALEDLERIPIDHLDSKLVGKKYFNMRPALLRKYLESYESGLIKKFGFLHSGWEKGGYKKISDMIDLYTNIEKNIKRAKVEIKHVPEAAELVRKMREDPETEYISPDVVGGFDKLNLELEKIYFAFGNPHAMNAKLIGENPANFSDWYLIEPQSDGKLE